MNEDDFYLDEDDIEDGDSIYYDTSEDDSSGGDSGEDGTFEGESSLDSDEDSSKDSSQYDGKLTATELSLQDLYDDIIAKDSDFDTCITNIVNMDPKNTSEKTVTEISKEILHLQGHARIRATNVNPSALIRQAEIDEEFEADEDTSFNDEFHELAKNTIAGFVNYLATRDLSQDSAVSKTRKLRQLPAFIIYLFSSGSYDYIINCPTMPRVYDEMINRAFKGLRETQNQILQELIQAYEDKGRPEVAEKIRQEGSHWFDHEPAQILDLKEYRDLDLTKDDVNTYKLYRSRYTNSSISITQDVISKYIEVQVDEKKGIYKPLRDKTRTEAINDVKREFLNWTKENATDASANIASKLIYKTIEED